MKIGYACIPSSIIARTTRRFTLKNYSEDLLSNLISQNLEDLLTILKFNNQNNIKLFRISSDIIPFGSHEINTFDWQNKFKDKLSSIGEYADSHKMRLSMHPGQFTVLNSPSQDIVNRAIKDLEYHTKFLDSLNLDSSNKIILHVGGVYDSKEDSITRFINTYNQLSQNIKNRLIIENDDKNYSIDDVLYISSQTSIPVVFDNLHNECFCNNNYTLKEILDRVSKTWQEKDGVPKTHYSQQDVNKKIGSHSKSIKIEPFLSYLSIAKPYNIDIMLEVKDKDFSAIKINNILKDESSSLSVDEKLLILETYKLFLTEKGDLIYKEATSLINLKPLKDFYIYLDEISSIEPSIESITNTLLKVFKSLEPHLNTKERNHFLKLRTDTNLTKSREYLYKMAIKYDITTLISAYYFHC